MGASAASIVLPSTWPHLFRPLILVAGAYAVDIDSEVEHPAALHRIQGILPSDRGRRGGLKRLTDLISETVKSWTMAPVVEAYQALRGVSLIAAFVFVAEIGDIRRFENPAS